MRYILYCDGACENNPGGRMSVGVIVKQRDGEKGAEKDTIIKEIPELLDKKGTNNQAEYLAIIKGLSFVQEKYRNEGGIPNLDMIVVLSDSELAINQIERKYKTKDSHLAELCSQVWGFRNFFKKAEIPVYFFHKPRHMMGAVHDLTIKAMGGEEKYNEYKYNEYVRGLLSQGKIVIPLTIFRRPEWSELTLAEAIVTELLENRKLTLKQVAEELGRNYHTVRTQYIRAKKKLPTRKND